MKIGGVAYPGHGASPPQKPSGGFGGDDEPGGVGQTVGGMGCSGWPGHHGGREPAGGGRKIGGVA
jgi:hypothetical protein